MLREVAREVFMVMPAHMRMLCITHDVRNTAAMRATMAAGFRAEAEVMTDGAPCTVFVLRAA